MERITRVSGLFTTAFFIGLLSIVIANGELTWATGKLVLAIVLAAGFIAGVWAVVHGHFATPIEIGLTIGIVVIGIVVVGLAMVAGHDILNTFKKAFSDGSAWWLVVPIVGMVPLALISEWGRPTPEPEDD